MASIDAAARINAIIDRAENLAIEQTANAGGYANIAVAAANGIEVLVGNGDVPSGSVSITYPVVTPPALSPIDTSPSGFSEAINEIEAGLKTSLADFFSSYFPNSGIQQAQAVASLQGLVDNAQGILNGLVAKANQDVEARGYLKSALTRTTRAYDRLDEVIAFGAEGSGYLSNRITNIEPATAYLLRRFDQGDAASATLLRMLSGDVAIPAAVENQTWQRDRARILSENARVKETTIGSWARRGFPLPGGSMIASVMELDSSAADRIAQSSRERAIKAIDVMLDNIRRGAEIAIGDSGTAARALDESGNVAARSLMEDARAATQLSIENARAAAIALLENALGAARAAIDASTRGAEQLIDLRTKGIQASVDYMRALSGSGNVAGELVKSRIDAEVAVQNAAVTFYRAEAEVATANVNAQVAVADLQLRPAIESARNRTALTSEENRARVGIAEVKSRAAMGACQAVGSIAAAAQSSLNAIASLSQNS